MAFPTLSCSWVRPWEKDECYPLKDHFTKTGSGRISESREKSGVFSQARPSRGAMFPPTGRKQASVRGELRNGATISSVLISLDFVWNFRFRVPAFFLLCWKPCSVIICVFSDYYCRCTQARRVTRRQKRATTRKRTQPFRFSPKRSLTPARRAAPLI